MSSEIIEISSIDLNDGFDSGFSKQKSSNFGGGLEFLMNDKVKESSKPSSDIDLADLTNLENELNDLSESGNSDTFSSFRPKTDLFNDSYSSSEKPSDRFSDQKTTGQNTADTSDN